MSQDSQDRRPHDAIYTQIDVSQTGAKVGHAGFTAGMHQEQVELLRDVLSAQDRTNELLEEVLGVMGATQKQRGTELNQWKQANPELADNCRKAAEGLGQVQVEFLNRMTDEINDTVDELMDGEFMLSEFVDRFGPRLAHLNGVIQVLAQLSNASSANDASQ